MAGELAATFAATDAASGARAAHTAGPGVPGPLPAPPAVPNARVEITGPGDWSAVGDQMRALLGGYSAHTFEVLIEVRDVDGFEDDATR